MQFRAESNERAHVLRFFVGLNVQKKGHVLNGSAGTVLHGWRFG